MRFIICSLLEKKYLLLYVFLQTFKDKCLISSVLMALHLLIHRTCSYYIPSGLLNSAHKQPRLRQEIHSSGFIPPTWSYNQEAEEERERDLEAAAESTCCCDVIEVSCKCFTTWTPAKWYRILKSLLKDSFFNRGF